MKSIQSSTSAPCTKMWRAEQDAEDLMMVFQPMYRSNSSITNNEFEDKFVDEFNKTLSKPVLQRSLCVLPNNEEESMKHELLLKFSAHKLSSSFNKWQYRHFEINAIDDKKEYCIYWFDSTWNCKGQMTIRSIKVYKGLVQRENWFKPPNPGSDRLYFECNNIANTYSQLGKLVESKISANKGNNLVQEIFDDVINGFTILISSDNIKDLWIRWDVTDVKERGPYKKERGA